MNEGSTFSPPFPFLSLMTMWFTALYIFLDSVQRTEIWGFKTSNLFFKVKVGKTMYVKATSMVQHTDITDKNTAAKEKIYMQGK